jgi:preprotein translocase subunit SecY
VNATGVMPVIFSSTLMSLPTGLAAYAPWLQPIAAALGPTGLLYLPVRILSLLTPVPVCGPCWHGCMLTLP